MRLRLKSGTIVENAEVQLVFDPVKVIESVGTRNRKAFLSHAHGDHVRGTKHEGCGMTRSTKSLAEVYVGRISNFLPISYGTPVRLSEHVSVTPYDAGHVLGSTQFLVDTEEETIGLTGDFNACATEINGKTEFMEPDTLIIESTYGLPKFIFPQREVLYADIVKWTLRTVKGERIPCFRAYPVGKAQEVVNIINNYSSIPVLVSGRVFQACEVYRQFGKKLEYIPLESPEGQELASSGGFAFITSVVRDIPHNFRKTEWAVVTGWALTSSFPGCSASFPLSGHSDFHGLLEYIETSNAKRIYTMHGFDVPLSKYLRRKGYQANPLRKIGDSMNVRLDYWSAS